MDKLIVSYLAKDIVLNQNLPRIYKINPGKTLLVGPPKSGKTTLAKSFALQYNKPVYISLKDIKICNENINHILLKMYLEKSIECLIIDDIEGIPGSKNNLDSIILPNIQNIVLISRSEIEHKQLSDFNVKKIYNLTFLEYVSFSHSNESVEQLFSTFLKDGNSPQMLNLPSHLKDEIRQKQILEYFGEYTSPMFKLLLFHGEKLSVNQLYVMLKKDKFKISKDKLYPFIEKLEKEGIIYFVYNKEKSSKKLFLLDFSLRHMFRFEKNLQATLDNILLLELLYMKRNGDMDEIYFYNQSGFIVNSKEEEILYIFLPFADKDIIENKLKKIESIKYAIVITLNFQGEGIVYGKSGIKYKAIEFSVFALSE